MAKKDIFSGKWWSKKQAEKQAKEAVAEMQVAKAKKDAKKKQIYEKIYGGGKTNEGGFANGAIASIGSGYIYPSDSGVNMKPGDMMFDQLNNKMLVYDGEKIIAVDKQDVWKIKTKLGDIPKGETTITGDIPLSDLTPSDFKMYTGTFISGGGSRAKKEEPEEVLKKFRVKPAPPREKTGVEGVLPPGVVAVTVEDWKGRRMTTFLRVGEMHESDVPHNLMEVAMNTTRSFLKANF